MGLRRSGHSPTWRGGGAKTGAHRRVGDPLASPSRLRMACRALAGGRPGNRRRRAPRVALAVEPCCSGRARLSSSDRRRQAKREPDRRQAPPCLRSRSVFGVELELAGADAGRPRSRCGGRLQSTRQMRRRLGRFPRGDGRNHSGDISHQPIRGTREVGRVASISGRGNWRPINRRRSLNSAARRARQRPHAPPPPSPRRPSVCRSHDLRPLFSVRFHAGANSRASRQREAGVAGSINRSEPRVFPPPQLGTTAMQANWTGCSSPSYFTRMCVEFNPQLVDNARRKLKSTLLRIATQRYAVPVAGRPQAGKGPSGQRAAPAAR